MDKERHHMSNKTIERGSESKVECEHLEEWVRGKVPEFVRGFWKSRSSGS